MLDIFITIRNQTEKAMTSVDGIIFVAILQQDNTVIEEKQLLKIRIQRFHFDFNPY